MARKNRARRWTAAEPRRPTPDGLVHRPPSRGLVWETAAIADLHLIPTGYERLLPPGVQLTVRTRRRALASRARGRVLDLGGADPHASLWPPLDEVDEVVSLDGASDPALMALARDSKPFDTVFSVFQLTAANDLGATLDRIARVLAADGQLLFLEPARRVGWSGRLQKVAAPLIGLGTGLQVARDIPVALREHDLSVVSLDRHRIATTQWWFGRLVEGIAQHRRLPPRQG